MCVRVWFKKHHIYLFDPRRQSDSSLAPGGLHLMVHGTTQEYHTSTTRGCNKMKGFLAMVVLLVLVLVLILGTFVVVLLLIVAQGSLIDPQVTAISFGLLLQRPALIHVHDACESTLLRIFWIVHGKGIPMSFIA